MREGTPFDMTLNLLGQELAAFVVYFLYESFFEWFFHKYLFHSNRFIKQTFRAHQLVHHQRYKFDPSSYEWQEGQEKDHIAMDWFALPLFIAFHLPIFWVVQRLTGWHSLWGGVASVIAYYTVYEYFHYSMHVPDGRWFEKLRVYRFVKEHHRVHHKYMQSNLNVFFPLADKCLGTFRSAASVTQKSDASQSQETANASSAPVNASPSAPISPARAHSLTMGERAEAVGVEK